MHCWAAVVFRRATPSMSPPSYAGTSTRKYRRRAHLDLRCTSADVHIRSTWLSTACVQATDRRWCCHRRSSVVTQAVYEWPSTDSPIKSNVDVFVPFFVELYNRSLSTSVMPATFKAAYVMLLLKKADMDPGEVTSYRPNSNLSVLSKLLERLVARQLLEHLNAARLLSDLQSAYWAYYSTETAVFKTLN